MSPKLLIALLLAAPVACTSTSEPRPAAKSARPNVLVIVTDDQRADETMEVMPQTRSLFGEGGTSFSRAYVTTPLCCPSRASIFTGRYVHNHGVKTNFRGAGRALDVDTTFQRYLHDAGYRTGLFGKYLTSEDIHSTPPYFDRWALLRFGYSGASFNIGGKLQTIEDYSTDFIADETVDFLHDVEDDDETPWLAYVAVNAPHRPFEPAPRHADANLPPFVRDKAMSESDLADKPPFVRNSAGASRAVEIRAGQLRSLMSVDDLVAEIFASLDELGESDDTLAIFVSDNGFFWGDHGLTDKRAPYLPSVRVPLFLRWPGHLEGGAVDDRRAANVDLAPTILDAAGIDPEHELDGRSLLQRWDRPYVFTEYFADPGFNVPSWAAVETDSFHFIRYFEGGKAVFEEYYDLKKDPFELENLLQTQSGFSVPPDVETLFEAGSACRGTGGASPCP